MTGIVIIKCHRQKVQIGEHDSTTNVISQSLLISSRGGASTMSADLYVLCTVQLSSSRD